jgi:hypothetical protein
MIFVESGVASAAHGFPRDKGIFHIPLLSQLCVLSDLRLADFSRAGCDLDHTTEVAYRAPVSIAKGTNCTKERERDVAQPFRSADSSSALFAWPTSSRVGSMVTSGWSAPTGGPFEDGSQGPDFEVHGLRGCVLVEALLLVPGNILCLDIAEQRRRQPIRFPVRGLILPRA